jgi:ubiquitin carboxyl-terminal hydrolase 4/11/15
VRAWKQFHLYCAPPILSVHLKLFHYSATTHRSDKITALIDIPLEGLDLREMVSHYVEGEEPIYDLYAVSNHYGGLGGGHYTAYTLSDDVNDGLFLG